MPSLHSRITYRASYPDPLGRIVATADFGTNGGQALERPDLIPARSATVRVLSTAYDAAGMAVRTTDPAGRVDEKSFDDAARLIQTVENKKESSSSSSSGLKVK